MPGSFFYKKIYVERESRYNERSKIDQREVYFVWRKGIYYIYRISDSLFLYDDGSWGPYTPYKVKGEVIKKKHEPTIKSMGLIVKQKPKGFVAKFR